MKSLSLFLTWTNLVLASQGFAAHSQPTNNIKETEQQESFMVSTETTKASGATVGNPSTSMSPKQATKRIAYLVYNPGAGQGDDDEDLIAIFNALEPEIPIVIHYTRRDIKKQCQEIVESIQNRPESATACQPMVVASGGDGTVSAVASAVLNTGIPFGVIPRGTANAFATALGIPTTSIEAACETLVTGIPRPVDAAACHHGVSDGTMILLAGIGWEANMVKTAQGRWKRFLGRLAYILGGVKETIAPESFRCKLRFDGGNHTASVKTHAITVAVTAPGGSVSAQGMGNVIPDDGLLDITIQTCNGSVLQSLNAMAHLLKAAVVQQPTDTDNIMHVRAKDIEIQCRSKQHVVEDGELRSKRVKTLRYSILPKALQVITPQSNKDENCSG